jgi:hypothetical protein
LAITAVWGITVLTRHSIKRCYIIQAWLLVAFIDLLFFVAPSSAAIVSVDGFDMRFTYDDSTLYGTVNVVGNNIYFLPTEFKAESLHGQGLVEATEMLNVQIEIISANKYLAGFQLP